MVPLLLTGVFVQAEINVLDLPIGPSKHVVAGAGWTSTASGSPSDPKQVAAAARGFQYVIFGESHDSKLHKDALATVIEALIADGRHVVLGLEMFTRPNQPNLAPWSRGMWSEETFIAKANWKAEWGFDYGIYKPVFDQVRTHGIPMVALNVPRDWVRQVGREGLGALPEAAKGQVPTVTLDNQNHRLVFNALMGGHPPTGARGENIYAAQCLWDVGMADTALKAMDGFGENPKRVMVILAGSGHALYGAGINARLKEQAGKECLTLIGISKEDSAKIRTSVGDFIYRTP